MKTLSRQDLEGILYSAAIMGAGGGGDLSEGFKMIDDAISKGKEFRMVTLDEASQDALVCTPYVLDAIFAFPPDQEHLYEGLPCSGEPAILAAYRQFKDYSGRKFYGTISCELGGSNTVPAFYAAAMSGAYCQAPRHMIGCG